MGMPPMPMPPSGMQSAAPSPASSGPGTPPPLASAPQQPQGPSPQDQVQGAIKQFQDIHALIEAMAQQFPEMADDAKQSLDALNTGMVKVISNIQGGTEVQSPGLAA